MTIPCSVHSIGTDGWISSIFYILSCKFFVNQISNWWTNSMLECFGVNNLNQIDITLSAYKFLRISDQQMTLWGYLIIYHLLKIQMPHLWNSGHSAWARNLSVCCIECGKIVLPMFDAFQICKNTLAMEPSTYYVSSCEGEGSVRKRQFWYNLGTTFKLT